MSSKERGIIIIGAGEGKAACLYAEQLAFAQTASKAAAVVIHDLEDFDKRAKNLSELMKPEPIKITAPKLLTEIWQPPETRQERRARERKLKKKKGY